MPSMNAYLTLLPLALLCLWGLGSWRSLARRHAEVGRAWALVQEALWQWHLGVRALLDATEQGPGVDPAGLRRAREAQAGAGRANGPLVQSESHDLLMGALEPLIRDLRQRDPATVDVEVLSRLANHEAGLGRLKEAARAYNRAAGRCSPSSLSVMGRLIAPFTGYKRPGLLRGSIVTRPDPDSV
jgi:hypothetical protein